MIYLYLAISQDGEQLFDENNSYFSADTTEKENSASF